jgi:hypothetical protein
MDVVCPWEHNELQGNLCCLHGEKGESISINSCYCLNHNWAVLVNYYSGIAAFKSLIIAFLQKIRE